MLEKLKEEVCKANKYLVKNRLTIFTWGNVSAISEDRKIVAIKPSGVAYNSLKPKDIVLVDLEGNVIEGDKKPSSDTFTHLEVYRNFDKIKSIVHTHSTFATIFAQAKKHIDCLGTTHADCFYGSVPVTRDLNEKEIKQDYEKNTGKVIVECFKNNKFDTSNIPACLVASHGPFVFGSSPRNAIHNAVVLEQIAEMNLKTISLNSSIRPINKVLLDKHYLRKHGKNAYYGQKRVLNVKNNP